MIQVAYTKAAYQEAKRTPPKDRTDEQHLLTCIDFRSGPNPIIRLSNGKTRQIVPGQILIGEENYSVQGLVDPEEDGADPIEEIKIEVEDTKEDVQEDVEEVPPLSAEEFFKDKESNSKS